MLRDKINSSGVELIITIQFSFQTDWASQFLKNNKIPKVEKRMVSQSETLLLDSSSLELCNVHLTTMQQGVPSRFLSFTFKS